LVAPLSASSPAATVIVPADGGSDLLLGCLRSLAEQDLEACAYEVVVVLRIPTERLAGLGTPYALTVVVQPGANAAAASNAGAARARAGVLVFLRHDAIAAPGLVRGHLEAHGRAERTVAVGHLHHVSGEHSERDLETEQCGFVDFDSGNVSLTRALFEAVGGYAEDLGATSDLEFAYRLHEAGAAFVQVPAAVASVVSSESWRDLLDRSARAGRASVELYRRHPSVLPHTQLGSVGASGVKKRGLQSLLISLRVSPHLLARAGGLVPCQDCARTIAGFVDDYSFWWGVRDAADDELWRRMRSPTMILLYHAFTRAGEPTTRFVVSAESFTRQMRWLKTWRYNVISLQSYLDSRREHRFPPRRSVVITFDDAYTDNVDVAKPILERFGFTATIFVVTASGPANGWTDDGTLAGRPLLRLSDLRGLTTAFDFGAHTRTHVQLDEVEPALARSEIVGSKRELEEALERSVESFAYPYGAHDTASRKAVEQAGFAGACTTRTGGNVPSTDSFELRRLEIRGGYSLLRFALTLVRGNTAPILARFWRG
jgi:peptidoglycan/xylan/chitin deacetylase (PgdA/CDA1 family)/GT2 family glycosyltransferase